MPSVSTRVLAPSQFDRSAALGRATASTSPPPTQPTFAAPEKPNLAQLQIATQDSLSLGENLSARVAGSVTQLNGALQTLQQLTDSGENASLSAVLTRFQSETLPQNRANLQQSQSELESRISQLPPASSERQSLELELAAVNQTLDLYQAAEQLLATSPVLNARPSSAPASAISEVPAGLAPFSPAQRAILNSDPVLLSSLVPKLEKAELKPLLTAFLAVINSPESNPESSPEKVLASLQLLFKTQPESSLLQKLLPPNLQPLAKIVLQQKDSHLNKLDLLTPQKQEKILAQLTTLASLKDGQPPSKEQLLALAELAKTLGADLKTIKDLLPASGQRLADAFSKSLGKYQSLNPVNLEKFISALATLSDDQVNSQDAGALLQVIEIGGREALNFKEFLPERLQGVLTRLVDEHLLSALELINGQDLNKALTAVIEDQPEKGLSSLVDALKKGGKVLLKPEQQKALTALLEVFLIDSNGQKLLSEALAAGDEKRLTSLVENLGKRTNSLNSSLQTAAPTPTPTPTPAPSAAETPPNSLSGVEARPEVEANSANSANLEKAIKTLDLPETDLPVAQKLYANLSEKEAKNLTKALDELDGPMRSKMLALLANLPEGLIRPFLQAEKGIKVLTQGLSGVIQNFDKLKVSFAIVLPKLAKALEKSLPILGAQQSFSDAQRLMGIAQTGNYLDPATQQTTRYTDPTIRAMALVGAGLNQADTGLALFEALGIGLVGVGPQVALALGSASLEIMMGVYNEDPSSIPANVKEGVKALALGQALVSDDAAAVVKEIYGVEGTAAILAELGDSIVQLDQTETGRIAVARLVLLKAEFRDGVAKAFATDVLDKGGKASDFLLNQLKAGSVKVESLFDGATGKLSQASRELLARFAASGSEALQTVYSKLIAQPSDELFQFTRQALDSGLLKLEDVVAGLKGADGKLSEKALTLLVDLFKNGKVQLEAVMDTLSKVISDPTVLKDFASQLLDKAGNQIDQVLDLAYQKGVNIADLLAERVLAGKSKAKEGLQTLQGFIERQGQALAGQGDALLQAFKAKVGPLLQSATRVAQATGTQVRDIASDLKKTLTDISGKLKDLSKLGLDELNQLLQELDRIGDDVIAALGDTRFGKEANQLLDKLGSVYKQAQNLADRSVGATKEVLLKIGKKAEGILSEIAQSTGRLASKAGQVLESTRNLLRDVVLRSEDEFADVARRLGLDAVPDSLKKALAGLDPKDFQAAVDLLAKLGPENSGRLLAVLDFLPDFALRNMFKSAELGAKLVNGITQLFDTLESQIGKKITGPMLKVFSEKIAKGLGKAIPLLGAALSAYDTARTTKIFLTGKDLNGNAYNGDARMLAYIGSKLNLLDTALGVAEVIPGVAVLSAAPSIGLALGSTALDILADYYNDPQNQMPPAAQGKLLMAAQAVAVGTLDPVGFMMLSEIAGDQTERTAEALVELVQSGKPKAEIEKFVKSLSQNWSQNDDITRLFLRKLEAKGIPLRAGAFSDETLKLLFKNLDTVVISRTSQDYGDMRTLAMAGGPSVRAYAIDRLSAQQTNASEEQIIFDLITRTDSPQLDKLLTSLKEIQGQNKRSPAGVSRLIYELEDDPVRLKGFVTHLAQEKSSYLDEVFDSPQLNNQQVLGFARTLLADRSIALSDAAKLAIFKRAAQEGDLALVEKLLTGTSLKTKQAMIGVLAGNLTRFQVAFGSDTQNAGKVASWILAYGSKTQIETAFTGLDNSLKSWFGRGTEIIKQALDYADANGINLSGKLTKASLTALVGNLDSNWSKLFGNHAENLSYVKRLADISDVDGKAAILNSLITGWTPTQSEALIFNILNGASDTEFRSLIEKVGAQRIADELNSPSLSGQQRAAASQRLGQVMARIVTTFENPNPYLDGVLKDITGRGNIMSDDIVDAMIKSLYSQGKGAALGKINDTNLGRLIDQYSAYKDGNFIYLDDASKVSINRLKAAHSSVRLRGRR